MARPLEKLLLDLVATNPNRRGRAEAILFSPRQEELKATATSIVSSPDFPRRQFFLAAAKHLITRDALWQWHDRPKPITTPTRNPDRLAGRKFLREILKPLKPLPPEEPIELSVELAIHLSNTWPAALEAPEALWAMLDSGDAHTARIAAEILVKAGTRATHFLPDLIGYHKTTDFQNTYPWADMLAAVGSGDSQVINYALAGMRSAPVENYEAENTWTYASILRAMGPPAGTPEVIRQLHEYSVSEINSLRSLAAHVLPAIAPNDPATRHILLRLLSDPDVDGDEDAVVPAAVSGCAHLKAFAAPIAERLNEMLLTYVEPNPDYGYGGEAVRICQTLTSLGPEAIRIALPGLRTVLGRIAKGKDIYFAQTIVQTLAKARLSREVLPELKKLLAVRTRQTGDSALVRREIAAIVRRLEARATRNAAPRLGRAGRPSKRGKSRRPPR